MLTHADAQASIYLADAAKRDSGSTKTIAIMTMGFLPATFFAALFAVPSLQWDQPDGHVMQSNFRNLLGIHDSGYRASLHGVVSAQQ